MIDSILNYEVLRVIWWMLMGFLLAGFAVMDGFDLGVAILLPALGRDDIERRIMLNTVGPVWEGNQVWFILGGGAIFAAWPYLYAVSFSGFYIAMFLLLLTFIFRPVGFKYRSKLTNDRWRNTWDWILCISGFLAALVFGVAIGNTLQGVPFYFDNDIRSFYTGTLWQLFNPFALLCGVLSVSMIVMQGAHYLVVKTNGMLRTRAIWMANGAAVLTMVLFAFGGWCIQHHILGYVLLDTLDPNAASNPLHHHVVQKIGAWLDNYYREPWLLLVPLMVFVGASGAALFARMGRGKLAFICSSVSVFFCGDNSRGEYVSLYVTFKHATRF